MGQERITSILGVRRSHAGSHEAKNIFERPGGGVIVEPLWSGSFSSSFLILDIFRDVLQCIYM